VFGPILCQNKTRILLAKNNCFNIHLHKSGVTLLADSTHLSLLLFGPLAFSDDAFLLPVWACNLEMRSVLFWIPAPTKTAKQAGLNSFPGKFSMITTLDQQ
jgi:hypothetical protein